MHLKAIDLFAGAGGLSFAASKLGFEILAAIEIDKDACVTFQNNIKNTGTNPIIFNEDISKDNLIQSILKESKLKKGDLDLLIGGPPCQGFSTHRIKGSGINDPRNSLLFSYFEFVKVIRPKVFLIENVTGILWKRHSDFLNKLLELADKSGYDILGPSILNAKDFGVPQNRKRVFIAGIDRNSAINRKNFIWPPTPSIKSQKSRPLSSIVFEPPTKKEAAKIKSVIGEDVFNNLSFGKKLDSKDPCAIRMMHSDEIINRFESTPINGSRKDSGYTLQCHKNHSGHNDVYGRIKLAEPTNTITTGCNNPSKGRFVHPWKNHGITLRHAARLQTFPDSFIFHGSQTSQARQIGNSVPPEMGVQIINAITELLTN